LLRQSDRTARTKSTKKRTNVKIEHYMGKCPRNGTFEGRLFENGTAKAGLIVLSARSRRRLAF
jgi:hypothetical protein